MPGGVLYTCSAARLAARLAVALAARLRSAAARFAGTGAGGPAGAGAGAGAGSCAGAGMGGAGAGGAAAAAAFARSIAAAAAALGFADFASAAGDDEAAAARLRLEEGGASASAARAVFLIARPPRLRCSIPSASRDSILVNAATPETNVGSQHCLSVLVIGRVRMLYRVRSAFWISPGRAARLPRQQRNMALRLLAVLVVLQLAAAAKKEDPNDCEGACTPTAGWRSAARTPQQRCRIRGCAASSVPHMPLLLLHCTCCLSQRRKRMPALRHGCHYLPALPPPACA